MSDTHPESLPVAAFTTLTHLENWVDAPIYSNLIVK